MPLLWLRQLHFKKIIRLLISEHGHFSRDALFPSFVIELSALFRTEEKKSLQLFWYAGQIAFYNIACKLDTAKMQKKMKRLKKPLPTSIAKILTSFAKMVNSIEEP